MNFRAGVIAASLLAVAGCASQPKSREVPPAPRDVASIPDAVPRAEPRSQRGNPPFYEVFGKRYHVLATAEGYRERGLASWYGPGFHAQLTSSGEPYDMYAMTAAHKTLPLPAYARVTNLENGRSIVVRINDRGPFVAGRIIDLSYTAAAKLDMLQAGTAKVEVETITPGSSPARTTQASPAPGGVPNVAPGPLQVQAGAFSDQQNAQRLVERLQASGIHNAWILPPGGNRSLHIVRVGPLADSAEFDAVMARLASFGITDARLALD